MCLRPGSEKSSTNAGTADTALRLARYFKTNPEFWLNLQNFFDLEVERRSGTAVKIDRDVHPAATPAP